MGAPKGNLYALGNTGGRPPEYTDANVMMNKIAEYLDWEDSNKPRDTKSGLGKGVYTLSGAALFLGFASRQSMYDYEKISQEFAYVLNRFRLFMTHWNEQKLYWGGTFQGSFVWLKNHGGYVDESSQNINSVVTEVKPQIIKDSPPLANKE